MAQSYNYYVGDGVTTAFQFTQELNTKATVIGIANFAQESGTWNSGTGFFTFDVAPASGVGVFVARATNNNEAVATYPNKSYISSENLDANERQSLMQVQELQLDINLAKLLNDGAPGYAADAAASAAAALVSEQEAALSETAAGDSETAALASENKAFAWAETAWNVEVEPSLYSAKHWAQESQNNASLALQLDGSTTMTGAIKTSSGTIESTRTTTGSNAPIEITSDQVLYGNEKAYLTSKGSDSKGIRIYDSREGYASYNYLTVRGDGYTGIFDGLLFKAGGILGQVLFTNDTGTNKLGFNPGANMVVTSHASEIVFGSNHGGTPLGKLSTTAWTAQSNGQVNLGALSTRFKNGYFSEAVTTVKAAPTEVNELTRKDYVDQKAVDEAIAFSIALGG